MSYWRVLGDLMDLIDEIIETVLESVDCELQDVSEYNVNACAYPVIQEDERIKLKESIKGILAGIDKIWDTKEVTWTNIAVICLMLNMALALKEK